MKRPSGATLVRCYKVGIKVALTRYKNVMRKKFFLCLANDQRRRVQMPRETVNGQDRLTASSDRRFWSTTSRFQNVEKTTRN